MVVVVLFLGIEWLVVYIGKCSFLGGNWYFVDIVLCVCGFIVMVVYIILICIVVYMVVVYFFVK